MLLSKKLLAAGVAAILAVTLAGCGANTGGGGAGSSDTSLDIVMKYATDTMDPHNSGQSQDRTPMFAVFESLVAVDQQLNYKPGLATDWKISADLMTVTMTLRSGVKFQDGTAFDAKAAKWNLDRMLEDTTLRTGATVRTIGSVEANGPLEIILHMAEPNSAIIPNLAERGGMMISPTAAKKNPEEIASKPVGTGPFKLKSWTRGSEMVLTRNADYWGEKAKVEQVTLRSVPESPARLNALTTGQADVAEQLEPSEVERAQKEDRVVSALLDSPRFQFVAINTKVAPWDDVRVRQALAWSLDREAIKTTIYKGNGAISNGPLSEIYPIMAGHLPAAAYPKRNLDKAKKLLAEAGHADGVELTVNGNSDPATISVMELIKAQAADAGITINVNPMDSSQMIESASTHTHEASAMEWSGRTDPDLQLYNQYSTGGGANYADYSNPRVDELLKEARATADNDARATAFGKIQAILLNDSPWVWTVDLKNSPTWRKGVKGVQAYPDMSFRNLNLVSIGG